MKGAGPAAWSGGRLPLAAAAMAGMERRGPKGRRGKGQASPGRTRSSTARAARAGAGGLAGDAGGTVRLACAYCGKRFACVRDSLAHRMQICQRCFEAKFRFPEICQRP